MKKQISTYIKLAGTFGVLALAVACNDKHSESSTEVTTKDTNFVDTRRNTATDTGNYLNKDSTSKTNY
jgi:hypothetical protein